MSDEIVKINDKIVNPVDFFKDVAEEFRSKGLKNFHFLMPDGDSDVFVTRYSTCGRHICFTKKELLILGRKESNYSIIRKASLFKVRWKIRLFKIQTIMPIYNNKKIICLILFGDKFIGNWLNEYLTNIKQDIEFCLSSILLYNQTLERIKREYGEDI
ncbi:MAG: hypothetical protein COT24_03795 [Candidatus Kerfeldbacteria bacterium CG08_land_8_20_14_0_20_40_16]|uniref:Uncharacterized protein n=1 Tax=Candidatus Kerfeldbacteria bacterium CG08_land_8_20_14_0_20_40_16 TaxID=2014244 RepID=A0A2H0YV60_9BACT|nr:MAG: hypothetical protein COT24_03795 [Candidatus Kerfeldbacteria bacterium CG08_land_8_20_14_0_20_40_16]